MRVRMKTPGRHDGKPFQPGDLVTLEDKEAAALIARGLCVAATEGESIKPEAASAKPQEAEASARRGRPKKDGD